MKPIFGQVEEKKRCTGCKKKLAYSRFHKRRHYKRDGLRSKCKECRSTVAKEARESGKWKKPDPKKQRVRAKTRWAKKKGEIESLPCEECGKAKTEFDHKEYDSPDAYRKGNHLCKKHHSLKEGKRMWTNQREIFPEL